MSVEKAIKLLEGLEKALVIEFGEAVVDCQYGDLRRALEELEKGSGDKENRQ